MAAIGLLGVPYLDIQPIFHLQPHWKLKDHFW